MDLATATARYQLAAEAGDIEAQEKYQCLLLLVVARSCDVHGFCLPLALAPYSSKRAAALHYTALLRHLALYLYHLYLCYPPRPRRGRAFQLSSTSGMLLTILLID
jgi:hypothetical protein